MDIRKIISRPAGEGGQREGEEFDGRGRLWEQATILFHIIRWSVLGAIAGIVSGAATTMFLNLIRHGTSATASVPSWVLYVLPPIAGLACGALTKYLSPRSAGIDSYIRDVHKNDGQIPFSVAPVKMVSSVTGIVGGFSVGNEGPAAHIGATLCSFLAWCFDLTRDDRRKIVICGISGGFAAVFGTPISGALFGVEVLFLGRLLYEVLYPSFIAGIVATWTATTLGSHYDYHSWDLSHKPALSPEQILYFILAGVLFGVVAWIFIEGIKFSYRLFSYLKVHPVLKPVIGGLIVSLVILLLDVNGLDGKAFLGLGTESIGSAVAGKLVALGALAFLAKIFLTSISLGSGASGGIVTPIFFVGATSGIMISTLLPLDQALMSRLGTTALLAACANTPVSASVMSLEIFGPETGWVAALTCVIAFLVVGHRSVFSSQILGLRKTDALAIAPGVEIGAQGTLRPSYDTVRKLAVIRHILRGLFGR